MKQHQAGSNNNRDGNEPVSILRLREVDESNINNDNSTGKTEAKGKEWRKSLIMRTRTKTKGKEKPLSGKREVALSGKREVAEDEDEGQPKRSFIREFALPPIQKPN